MEMRSRQELRIRLLEIMVTTLGLKLVQKNNLNESMFLQDAGG